MSDSVERQTQDVINALDAKVDARIDTAVANGKLKPENAANLKTRAHDRIEKFINKTLPRGVIPNFPYLVPPRLTIAKSNVATGWGKMRRRIPTPGN